MLEVLQDQVPGWLAEIGRNPWLRSGANLLLYLVLARFGGWLTGAVLSRWLGSDSRRLTSTVRKLVLRTVALAGVITSIELLPIGARVASLTLAGVESLLILVWVAALITGGRLLLEGASGRRTAPNWVRPTTVPLLNNLMRVLLALAGAYAILMAWNVNVTGLVASAGIVGIALSFAAQDTLGNLFAGVAILIDRPYQFGDYIVLDSGERGQVTHIGLRSTRLLTRDDEEVSIPNGIMGRAKIVNESGGPYTKYRLRVKIGVAYGSDIDQVMAVLIHIAADHPNVCRIPEPRVRLRGFGDSSVDFELLVWIEEPALRGLALHELNCSVYRRFAAEGITIPFPQRDVHLRDHRQPGQAPSAGLAGPDQSP
ncbi:MAG: mechanosensitive ion channel family protein [Gammaproteobacteria bacterium]